MNVIYAKSYAKLQLFIIIWRKAGKNLTNFKKSESFFPVDKKKIGKRRKIIKKSINFAQK